MTFKPKNKTNQKRQMEIENKKKVFITLFLIDLYLSVHLIILMI